MVADPALLPAELASELDRAGAPLVAIAQVGEDEMVGERQAVRRELAPEQANSCSCISEKLRQARRSSSVSQRVVMPTGRAIR
jgi:hypothetical protein